MKKVLQYGVLSLLLGGLFASCKKDENRVFFEGGTSPQLTSNQQATIPLSFPAINNQAVTFSWTNPDYKFTTGLSSQNVTYLWEMDTAGANFTNPKRKQIFIANDLSRTFTQGEINDFMLNQLELAVNIPHDLEFRVKTSISGSPSTELVSNVVKLKATPFVIPPKVAPPDDGTLWIVGNATRCGWQNPLPAPYDVENKFTRVSNTLYELTISLPGGGNYKLIQTQGAWGTQYRYESGSWDGGTFEKRDADPGFDGPPESGTYKMTFDFQRGKYSVIRQ